MAKRQSGLVRGEAVANVAYALGIGKFIKMTQGEEFMGGRDNASNVENALEAVIGAIYLDGGGEMAADNRYDLILTKERMTQKVGGPILGQRN